MLTTIKELIDSPESGDLHWFRAAYGRWRTELSLGVSLSETAIDADIQDVLQADHYRIFLIQAAGQSVGFAIMNSWDVAARALQRPKIQRSQVTPGVSSSRGNRALPDHELIEFFIDQSFRQRGIGAEAARLLLARFAGLWQVSQLDTDRVAVHFWRAVITRASGGEFSESHADGRFYQRFRSGV